MTEAALLGRKQGLSDQSGWHRMIARCREMVPDPELDRLIDQSVTRVLVEKRAGKRIATAWSGGKDSLALMHVMELAGVHDCVMGMTTSLEYPAMLRWVTAHMPDGLTVMTRPLDLLWLKAHPMMLFPQGAYGPRWFSLIQHRVQRDYFAANDLDLLALGRRKKDGNYVGPKGQDRYTDAKGTTRWSPIADWSHEAVLSLLVREHIDLPPCYSWPRGFQVGTGAWPARQFTSNRDQGWCEVWEIDPDVVRQAAEVLPEARDWMRRSEVI